MPLHQHVRVLENWSVDDVLLDVFPTTWIGGGGKRECEADGLPGTQG